MTQLDIFSIPVHQPAEARRLSGQCAAILARLHQGPATREEIAAIGRNATARVSDLRKAGHDVRCVEHNRATGFTRYALIGPSSDE
jgi:hypothetical protein